MSEPIKLQDGTWWGVLDDFGTSRSFRIMVQTDGPDDDRLSAAYYPEARTLVLMVDEGVEQIVTGIVSLRFLAADYLDNWE